MDVPQRHPWLLERGRTFYLRAKVPLGIRQAVGRSEIKISLRTSDRREAVSRLRLKAAEVEAQFAAARRISDLPSSERATENELEELAQHHFAEMDRETVRLHTQWWAERRPDLEQVIHGFDEAAIFLSRPTEERPEGMARSFSQQAAQLLHRAGYRPEREGVRFCYLLALLQRAELELARRSQRRLRGDFEARSFDPLFPPLQSSATPLQGPHLLRSGPGAAHSVRKDLVTVDELIRRYEADPKRRNVSAKTRGEDRRVFAIMREVFGGDTQVEAIDRSACRNFQQLILRLPKNAEQRMPDLSAHEAANRCELEGLEGLSPKGANKYLHKLAAVFRFAEQEQLIGSSPARGLAVPGQKHSADDRHPFSPEQLARIFSAPLYTGCKDDENGYAQPGPNILKRGRYWVPLLSLYMGLRLNEACQLQASDVAAIEGIPCIRVQLDPHDPERKRIKSRAGVRVVPIHPNLIELGFPDFVQQLSKVGESRLFPELTQGQDGFYSSPFSKWFGRFLRRVGAYSRRTTFHSFRHNFRDALRRAGVPEEAACRLGGWEHQGGTSAKYGSGYGLKALADHVAEISYDSLSA